MKNAAIMSVPDKFVGIRLGMGPNLPSNHFVAKLITKHPDYAEWFDRRYRRVFENQRVCIDPDRRQRLMKRLMDPSEFNGANPEVQTMATIVRDPEVIVYAGKEDPKNVSADLTVERGTSKIDVEVRILQEGKGDQV